VNCVAFLSIVMPLLRVGRSKRPLTQLLREGAVNSYAECNNLGSPLTGC
jgi:hypothetical protein